MLGEAKTHLNLERVCGVKHNSYTPKMSKHQHTLFAREGKSRTAVTAMHYNSAVLKLMACSHV